MIDVPVSLKTEIQKLRGRRLEARCRLDFSDASIDNTIIAFGSSVNNSGIYSQLYNGKEDMSFKWMSCDGFGDLGGSWRLMPDTPEAYEKYEAGWWSEEISAADTRFSEYFPNAFGEFCFSEQAIGASITPPSVFVNFTPRQVAQVKLAFDNMREEYAEEFDVRFYNSLSQIIGTHSVTGNLGYKYNQAITILYNVCMMEIKILKWSHAGTNAKIAEMYTMISQMINGSDIMSLQVIENRELSDDNLPVGTSASGSCVMKFFNRDRLYDWDNSTSRLFNFIRKGVKIIPEIGDGTNWIPLGVYFAEEWDIPKNELSVVVSGMDRMAALDKSEYITSQAVTSPDDLTITIDTAEEWESATMNGVEVSGATIRMIF
jgi:hypothetical protein